MKVPAPREVHPESAAQPAVGVPALKP